MIRTFFATNELFSNENKFSFYVLVANTVRRVRWKHKKIGKKEGKFALRRRKQKKIEWLMYQQWFHTISIVRTQCLFSPPLSLFHYRIYQFHFSPFFLLSSRSSPTQSQICLNGNDKFKHVFDSSITRR
jgi:hypothetical protein